MGTGEGREQLELFAYNSFDVRHILWCLCGLSVDVHSPSQFSSTINPSIPVRDLIAIIVLYNFIIIFFYKNICRAFYLSRE